LYQNCSLILKFHLLIPGPTNKISTKNQQSKSVYWQIMRRIKTKPRAQRDLQKRPIFVRKRNVQKRPNKETYLFGKRLTNRQIMRSTKARRAHGKRPTKETYINGEKSPTRETHQSADHAEH